MHATKHKSNQITPPSPKKNPKPQKQNLSGFRMAEVNSAETIQIKIQFQAKTAKGN